MSGRLRKGSDFKEGQIRVVSDIDGMENCWSEQVIGSPLECKQEGRNKSRDMEKCEHWGSKRPSGQDAVYHYPAALLFSSHHAAYR